MNSFWIRFICLISIVAAHGPQHHAFAHDHVRESAEADQCPVKGLHFESAKAEHVDPETDCLTCQVQAGKALHDPQPIRSYVPEIPNFLADRDEPSIDGDFEKPSVRGPPFMTTEIATA